jgi:hypothetical protein
MEGLSVGGFLAFMLDEGSHATQVTQVIQDVVERWGYARKLIKNGLRKTQSFLWICARKNIRSMTTSPLGREIGLSS